MLRPVPALPSRETAAFAADGARASAAGPAIWRMASEPIRFAALFLILGNLRSISSVRNCFHSLISDWLSLLPLVSNQASRRNSVLAHCSCRKSFTSLMSCSTLFRSFCDSACLRSKSSRARRCSSAAFVDRCWPETLRLKGHFVWINRYGFPEQPGIIR